MSSSLEPSEASPPPSSPDGSLPDHTGPDRTDDESEPKSSRLISAVLTPALRLWLRSQLEQVDDLQLQIEAGDRQLLSGNIRRVSASARNALYQGLHLSQVDLTAEQIRINLGQVIRGKPLRLLTAFPVTGTVQLRETDLNASLKAPLLADAVLDLLRTLLKSGLSDSLTADRGLTLHDPQVILGDGFITLIANLLTSSKPMPVVIRTGLRLENQQLALDRPQWLPRAKARQGLPLTDLDGFCFELGSDVALEELTIQPGLLVCRGRIQVTPEETA